ncbi:hypothetical protein GUA46_05700 [Muricauda sp. HICW]|uniref:Uncharacterized protein n=1 Tax=Flagellimonas chongwuensis TaxID=2697365 RepID=A0A850NG08_9FLAO|nr:hypothetical protein [Allomuricauda chongwuensis]NVN17830.1 hypothetical protein [Allomuricauda chongwuensis]
MTFIENFLLETPQSEELYRGYVKEMPIMDYCNRYKWSAVQAWFDAGATYVNVGSKLICKGVLGQNDFEGLQKKVVGTLKLTEKIGEKE